MDLFYIVINNLIMTMHKLIKKTLPCPCCMLSVGVLDVWHCRDCKG
jgi:hypothetical protein